MTRSENMLKAICFEQPDYIPMNFHINNSCWHNYDQNVLQDLMEGHPLLFPDFVRQEKVVPDYCPTQLKDKPYTDPWGCLWETSDDGVTGAVTKHPLPDWDMLDNYLPPDPDFTDGTCPFDWNEIENRVTRQRQNGEMVYGGLPHGHTFLRLQDIRGYQNLLFDMIDEAPKLIKLIEMVEEFNYQFVQKWLELKPNMMIYPEDLGMQVGPMLSPDCFRKYIKPVYKKLMKPARDQGCIIHMHSDGDIRTLADDLIEGGVQVINLQDLVNGIDWIADKFADNTCIDLDIDRQSITLQGTPEQIDNLIREEVEKLGSKSGGLMMTYGLYAGLPIENVKAVMDAMEKYASYYS